MKRISNRKPVDQMTVAELEAMTADLDREFIADTFSPLTPEQREQWERAKHGGVRVSGVVAPRTRSLLNALAKKQNVTPSTLVARGVQILLAAAGEAELTPITSSAAPSRPRRSAKTSRRTRRKVA